MPRVFVAHQPRPKPGPNSTKAYDITPALQYGDVVFVFDASFSPSSDPDRAFEIAQEKMADITSDDYIVSAGGDPLASFIVGAIALDKTDGKINYLKWDRQRDAGGVASGRGVYAPVELDAWPE